MTQEQDPLEELKKLKAKSSPARQLLIRSSVAAESTGAPPRAERSNDQGPGYAERFATTLLTGAQVIPGMKPLQAAAGAVGSRAYHMVDKSQPVLSYRDSYHALEDNMEGLGTGRQLAAQLVSSPVLAPIMASRGVRALGTVGSGAALGGATGLLEGDPDATASDVALRTTVGAGAGALAGAIVPPLAAAVGRKGSKIVTALGLRPSGRTAEEMAADAATLKAPKGPERPMAEAMGNNTPATGNTAAPTLGQRVRATTGRQVGRVIEPTKQRALRQVAERFSADNVSGENATALATRHPGKPVAVLDLGDGNVSGLARTAKDTPGLGRALIPRFLEERSAGVRGDEGRTLQRITADFENRIGLKPENYYQTIDEMTAEMKTAAAENYGKIRGQVVDDPEVLALFDIPEFRSVHDAIRRNASIRGGEKIPALSSEQPLADGKMVSKVQNPQTLGTLDKMKRHLDQIIGGKIEGGPIQRDAAYAMRERLNTVLDRMDELYPDYKAARAQYRGSAEAIDAFEQGRDDFLKLDPRLMGRKIGSMPERLQDVYRRGGYDALRGKLVKMKDGANIGEWLESNPDVRDRVAALARQADDVGGLRDDLGIERHMGQRKTQILGGPNTAERLIDHAHASVKAQPTSAGNMARNVPVVGRPLGAALDSRVARRFSEETSDVMGEVAKIMTRSGVEGIQATTEEIKKLLAEDLAREFARAGRYGTLAGKTSTEPFQRRR